MSLRFVTLSLLGVLICCNSLDKLRAQSPAGPDSSSEESVARPHGSPPATVLPPTSTPPATATPITPTTPPPPAPTASTAPATDTGVPPASAPRSAQPSDLTFGVGTTLVLVPVSVTDESNRYVLGLEKQNFKVFENGNEQKISQFSGEDAPLSVGLIVDTSGSIGDKLELSRKAVSEFLKSMNAHDEAFLVLFNSRAKLTVPFTSNAKEIETALKGADSSGYTALLDAVQVGLTEMKRAKGSRKALLVISDGGDNISHYTPSQITSLVRQADVQIYAMGVFEPSLYRWMTADLVGGPQLLADLSQQTGGRIFAVADEDQLPSVAEKIGIELRNQYLLAYTPVNVDRNGEYRKIKVQLAEPPGLPPLKARWRQGYYAPLQ